MNEFVMLFAFIAVAIGAIFVLMIIFVALLNKWGFDSLSSQFRIALGAGGSSL